MKKLNSVLLCLLFLTAILPALADQKPKALATDWRMRVVSYDKNNVVTVLCSQLVETSFQFGDDETIVGVNGGDSAAWTINVNKYRPNILFVKPTVDSSNANLTVLTDKNIYQFHLMALPNETASDKNVTYSVRFVYPEIERQALLAQLQEKKQLRNSLVTDNAVDPMNVNWNYSFSQRCATDFVPVRAFDDGKFTYFQFPNNTEIPAIFVVDQAGKESLANLTMRGNYVVIQRIARQFSLRNGQVMSCVFNDSYQS